MKVLMIGPLGPPYGGVANFITNISELINSKRYAEVTLHRVGRRQYNTNPFKQFLIDIIDLLSFIIKGEFINSDIIHIHTSSNYSFIRKSVYFFIIKTFSHNKIIIHIHGAKFDIFYKSSNMIIKKLIKYVLSCSDGVIVTSPRWAEIIRNIVKNANTFIVYNGFNDSFVTIPKEKIRYQIGLPLDKKILLNIGVLEEYKGHIYLIDSLETIIKNRDDILVYIIGEGTLKGRLETIIKTRKLDKNIFLIGRKPLNDLVNMVNASDLFVLSSLAEGNPTVMFEALSCGIPFVGTNVGGIPDIIISDDYGYLANPGDPEDLAKKILTALNREWNYRKIIEYGSKFSWQNGVNNILKIYNSLYHEI